MKTNKVKLGFLSAGLAMLVIAIVILFNLQGEASSDDLLLAQENTGNELITIKVTADSFEPKQIEIKAGSPIKINFQKTTKFTCIKSVGFKDLGIDFPLNKGNNVLTLGDLKPGTYEYHCGMYMYYGTIVVK